MKTVQRRGHPLSFGHQHHRLPSYSTLRGPSACRQEPCACEDASWLTCFDLGKERWEVAGRRSTFGDCWVEHGNCQQLPAHSHITPPCCVPPTGCTEELIGLVAASHAQNCHHCVATWLPPSPSDAHSNRSDFHCVLASLTALTGIHSLLQTWDTWEIHTDQSQRIGWTSLKRFGFPNFEICCRVIMVLRLLFLRRGNTCHAHHCSVNKAQISWCPCYICLKTWVWGRKTGHEGKEVSLLDSSILFSSSPSVSSLFFPSSYFHLLPMYLTMSILSCFQLQQMYFKCCQILMGRMLLCVLYHRLRISVDQKLGGISYFGKKKKKKLKPELCSSLHQRIQWNCFWFLCM